MAQPTNPMAALTGLNPDQMDEAIRAQRAQRMAQMLQAQADQPLNGQMVGNIYVAPSWTQGLAKVLNAYMGKQYENQAFDLQKQQARKYADMLKAPVDAAMVQPKEAVAEGWKTGGNTWGNQADAQQAAQEDAIYKDMQQQPSNATPAQTFALPNPQIDNPDVSAAMASEPGQYQGPMEVSMPPMTVSAPPLSNIEHIAAQPGQPGGFDVMKYAQAVSQMPFHPHNAWGLEMLAKGTKSDDLVGKVMPNGYTPKSLAKFQQSRNYADLEPVAGSGYGKINPGQFTPESLALYSVTGNWADLVPFRAPVQIDQGNQRVLHDVGTGKDTVYKKSMTPGEAVDARDRGRKMDYELPKPQSGGFSVTDPDGGVHVFQSKDAADRFRKAIGGK